ncbi:GNAT family N-acetyltransferase [Sphingomonas sp.]|uniref:GNAT family N-acetyltransferase n=1 Tax=Sphingomonas sp. TaxID=28214 RepID=UPI002EDB6C62
MTIVYDTPALADADALDAMAQETWTRTFGHGYAPADLEAYLAQAYGPTGRLRAHLADPAVTWQVARAEGRIVGYAKLVPPWLEEAGPHDAQLGQLYIAYDWHGKGVAQALMDWSIAEARRRNAPALLLTVFEENHRAIAFYAKYGFVHIGDYAFRVGEKIDRDLIMKLDL